MSQCRRNVANPASWGILVTAFVLSSTVDPALASNRRSGGNHVSQEKAARKACLTGFHAPKDVLTTTVDMMERSGCQASFLAAPRPTVRRRRDVASSIRLARHPTTPDPCIATDPMIVPAKSVVLRAFPAARLLDVTVAGVRRTINKCAIPWLAPAIVSSGIPTMPPSTSTTATDGLSCSRLRTVQQ
jgi:hypothetical protein